MNYAQFRVFVVVAAVVARGDRNEGAREMKICIFIAPGDNRSPHSFFFRQRACVPYGARRRRCMSDCPLSDQPAVEEDEFFDE